MIEKILEQLEASRLEYEKLSENKSMGLTQSTYYRGIMQGCEYSKGIVQEVAKEYDWIPVEQKTLEDFTNVYATCISLVDDRKPWVIEGIYNSVTGWKGMAPMLELEKAKVIAWMRKDYPAPYQKDE